MLVIAILLRSNELQSAVKPDIEVTAFYSDFVYQYDTIPDKSWTYHPFVQLRIKQTFEKDEQPGTFYFRHNFFINDIIPDLTIKNIVIETDSGTYFADGASDLIKKINRNDYGILRQITYSMHPFFGLGIKYIPQALYAMPSMTQSWFVSNKKNKTPLHASFNIDPSLFYIRCSKPANEQAAGKTTVCFDPDEEEPAFYLFYLPAYRHITYKEDKRTVDLLVENIDTALTQEKTIVYKAPDIKECDKTTERLRKTITSLDKYIGRAASPDSIFIVRSNQTLYRKMGDVETKAVFSRTHKNDKYVLILLDNNDYDTHVLTHEILHAYFKDIHKDSTNLYEYYFFSESLVEYLACQIYEETFKDTVFENKVYKMLENSQDRKKARELLKRSEENAVSLAGSEQNTSWIYYDLLPLRLKMYAKEECDNEETFYMTVINYLQTLRSDKQPSFDDFCKFMRKRGFKDIEKYIRI